MKTAVEWLIEKLTPSIALQQKYINELKEQAKKMEKQQIIDAVEWNYKSNMGEVYYNATFKPTKL
jgi:hypothetical protein